MSNDKSVRRDVCWFCGGTLCWGCDYDASDLGYDQEGVVAHLSCTNCNAQVEYVLLNDEDSLQDEVGDN